MKIKFLRNLIFLLLISTTAWTNLIRWTEFVFFSGNVSSWVFLHIFCIWMLLKHGTLWLEFFFLSCMFITKEPFSLCYLEDSLLFWICVQSFACFIELGISTVQQCAQYKQCISLGQNRKRCSVHTFSWWMCTELNLWDLHISDAHIFCCTFPASVTLIYCIILYN